MPLPNSAAHRLTQRSARMSSTRCSSSTCLPSASSAPSSTTPILYDATPSPPKSEKVIDALTSRSFNRHEFLKSLDRFYIAIEGAARSIDGWFERQHFLDTVYERFFQGYSVKRADTYGIVYTPQEIVDFMCASVEEVLQREFGTSISEPGVHIIDQCVGPARYIINLVNRIPNHRLKYKYEHDFFCNEIMLLAYYIASLNIEHEYYSRMGEYQPFDVICFTDPLELTG